MYGSYKFFNSKDRDRFEVGQTIKISTARLFAREFEKMEVKTPFINDPFEGKVNADLKDQHIIDKPSEEQKIAMAQLGIKLGDYQQKGFIDGFSKWLSVDNFYMFCSARGNYSELKEAFRDTYDACYYIPSLSLLANAILSGTVVFNGNNVKLCEIVDKLSCKQVEYRNLSFDLTKINHLIPSPFLKDTLFSNQQEERIVFGGDFEDAPDMLIVTVPSLMMFLKRV